MIKKSLLLSVLYISFVLLGPTDGICQTSYTPDQWQTTLASNENPKGNTPQPNLIPMKLNNKPVKP